MSSRPSYRRMDVDERRRQLLERGAELFTTHSYDELSMSKIAAEVGISKALLYHYFPSKQAFFEETLSAWAEELRVRTEPDPDLSPVAQLTASLDAFLAMVEENAGAYSNLMQSATGVPEIRDLIEEVRRATAERILGGLYPDGPPPPKARIAVSGWLWFMDGACLNWIEHRDVEREELRDLLLGVLMGALIAAGSPPDPAQVS
ncbi:MAG TPA: TetR/AcrR family transcriptional regulator [Solirubrobacterales bacterium]|jgi:AcrR family transcriptional regulator|nr:TetR/AcrR family transcriptional regulator [Solirubrobacterales bacterium]